jgi:aminoglycoside phosphotransferase (APT) family kinase protein
VAPDENAADEIDRSAIDRDLARRLVAAQFPQWAHLPVTTVAVEGWDNKTFRLGDEMTVRLPTGPWYAEQVAKEQRFLPLLAPQLPLPIPVPVGRGEPALGYPFPWSVYGWLAGEVAAPDRIDDLARLAVDLAGFLTALRHVDPSGGPAPGRHNFFRGGPLTTYDDETRQAIDALGPRVDRAAVTEVWETALAATWRGRPVWFHGDVAAGNLLVRDGRLAAVIDFGTSGVGDPSCDTAVAWTLLSGASRAAFVEAYDADVATWARGRGWTLWKALITMAPHADGDPAGDLARQVLHQVLADHARAG